MRTFLSVIFFFTFTISTNADVMKGLNHYKNGEYEQALEEILSDIDNANTTSLYVLGYMYWTGKGTEVDREEASKWYKKTIYKAGDNYPNDANAQSALNAMKRIERRSLGKERAEKVYARDPQETYVHGSTLLTGLDYLVTKDVDYGIYWLKDSAQKDNPDAIWLLARIYYEGKLVDKDISAALPYIESAANENNDKAQLLLANINLTGDGKEKNIPDAEKWAVLRAQNGNRDAINFLQTNFPNRVKVNEPIEISIQ